MSGSSISTGRHKIASSLDVGSDSTPHTVRLTVELETHAGIQATDEHIVDFARRDLVELNPDIRFVTEEVRDE